MSIKELKDKREEGFTLIEIVFVLAIAALIIVIVFLAVGGARNSANDQARKDWVNRLTAACDKVAGDNANGVTTNTCKFVESGAQSVSKAAGTPPSVNGTPLLTAAGSCSSGVTNTTAVIDSTSACIQLTSGLTYSQNF